MLMRICFCNQYSECKQDGGEKWDIRVGKTQNC